MRVLSFDDLKSLKGIRYSRVHVGRLEKVGKFPRRVRLSANYVGWREDEIDQWIEDKSAERNNDQ